MEKRNIKTKDAETVMELNNDWFTIEIIDENTSIISEYKHWEETHCYVLNGTERCYC